GGGVHAGGGGGRAGRRGRGGRPAGAPHALGDGGPGGRGGGAQVDALEVDPVVLRGNSRPQRGDHERAVGDEGRGAAAAQHPRGREIRGQRGVHLALAPVAARRFEQDDGVLAPDRGAGRVVGGHR